MGMSKLLDITAAFNASAKYVMDISEWDNVVVQLETPSAPINFNATNDSNAITGITDGSAVSAIQFQPIQATNLATGTSVTSASANGMFRFGVVGKFLELVATGGTTATKILVLFYKIS